MKKASERLREERDRVWALESAAQEYEHLQARRRRVEPARADLWMVDDEVGTDDMTIELSAAEYAAIRRYLMRNRKRRLAAVGVKV